MATCPRRYTADTTNGTKGEEKIFAFNKSMNTDTSSDSHQPQNSCTMEIDAWTNLPSPADLDKALEIILLMLQKNGRDTE